MNRAQRIVAAIDRRTWQLQVFNRQVGMKLATRDAEHRAKSWAGIGPVGDLKPGGEVVGGCVHAGRWLFAVFAVPVPVARRTDRWVTTRGAARLRGVA